MTMYLKLFGRESIPTCVKNISERHGQTNRQRERKRERERERERETTYCGITALCIASRG